GSRGREVDRQNRPARLGNARYGVGAWQRPRGARQAARLTRACHRPPRNALSPLPQKAPLSRLAACRADLGARCGIADRVSALHTDRMLLGNPLALGSWWSIVPNVALGALLVHRTRLEERVLLAELDGYRAYAIRVPARLLPGVW